MFLFPYSKIQYNSDVIIYGAGDVGAQYVRQIQLTGYCNILAVVDRNYGHITDVCGIKVSAPDTVDYLKANSVIIAVENMGVSKSISDMLVSKGVCNIIRDITRFSGAEGNDHFMEYQSFTLDKENEDSCKRLLGYNDAEALRRLLNQLRIKSYEGIELERVGGEADGGYVMEKLQGGSVAYSIGIGNEISWDAEMAQKGFDIYMYDYTVDSIPFSNEKFHFTKKGIAGQQSNDPIYCTLSEALNKNGHIDENHMILKMDIEGAEWEVLEHEKENVFEKFDQIVLECHYLLKSDKWRYYAKCLERLRRTHELVHIHPNNVCGFAWIDGLKLVDCLEFTFVKKENREFFDSNVVLPLNIDMPNICGLVEVDLGDWNRAIDRLFQKYETIEP